MADSVLSDGLTKPKAAAAAHRARRDPMRWVVLAILILLLAFTLFPFFLALLNAINDATGHRFRSLPVTTSLLKGALA